MKIDVIIPAYNPNHSHLNEAINSVLKQTYRNFEIFLVDDCSTKDLPNKIWPRVTRLKTPKNLGPAGARNYAISKCDGELISFLDADDYWDSFKLMKSVKEFQDNPDVGMTCGNYRIVANNRMKKPFYKTPINIDWISLMKVNYVASGSVTIRRDVFEEVDGFNEKYWIAEDYDLWVRVAEKYDIKYIHDVLYYYRIITDGKSLTQRDDIQKNHIKNIEEIKKSSKKRVLGR